MSRGGTISTSQAATKNWARKRSPAIASRAKNPVMATTKVKRSELSLAVKKWMTMARLPYAPDQKAGPGTDKARTPQGGAARVQTAREGGGRRCPGRGHRRRGNR